MERAQPTRTESPRQFHDFRERLREKQESREIKTTAKKKKMK